MVWKHCELCNGWMNATSLLCEYCHTRNEDSWKAGRVDITPRLNDDQWQINCDYELPLNEAHCQNKYCKELRDRYG